MGITLLLTLSMNVHFKMTIKILLNICLSNLRPDQNNRFCQNTECAGWFDIFGLYSMEAYIVVPPLMDYSTYVICNHVKLAAKLLGLYELIFN